VSSAAETPAERASRKALEEVYACLDKGQSFRLEAGAGAGKTYSLVKALQYLIAKYERNFRRRNRRIACITYTNVATDEIKARIDKNALVYCDTNHAFCWSLISCFQKQLREFVPEIESWKERLEEAGGIGERTIQYQLGFRSIRDTTLSLHHDDILPLTIKLM
jgi:DNA helicase-2/ATP-dependent DNA helicase PcrA